MKALEEVLAELKDEYEKRVSETLIRYKLWPTLPCPGDKPPTVLVSKMFYADGAIIYSECDTRPAEPRLTRPFFEVLLKLLPPQHVAMVRDRGSLTVVPLFRRNENMEMVQMICPVFVRMRPYSHIATPMTPVQFCWFAIDPTLGYLWSVKVEVPMCAVTEFGHLDIVYNRYGGMGPISSVARANFVHHLPGALVTHYGGGSETDPGSFLVTFPEGAEIDFPRFLAKEP